MRSKKGRLAILLTTVLTMVGAFGVTAFATVGDLEWGPLNLSGETATSQGTKSSWLAEITMTVNGAGSYEYSSGTDRGISVTNPTIVGESNNYTINKNVDGKTRWNCECTVGTITYENDEGAVISGLPNEPGSYKACIPVTFTLTKNPTTVQTSSNTFELKDAIVITKATLTPPEAIEGLKYTGSAQALVAAGSDELLYSTDGNNWSASVPEEINADNYTVYWKGNETVDPNYYNPPLDGIVTVSIGAADPTVTAPVAKTLTYNGSAQALAEAGKATGGTMQYALGTSATAAPTSGWSTSVPTGTNEGSYYVWYRVVGDKNHNDIEPACVTAKIVVPQYTITFDLNGGKLDGQTGVVTTKVEEGTVITLPSPTRSGYKFDYWEGSKYNAGDKYTVTADHTFKAVWKANKKGVDTGDTNDIAGLLALMIASVGALGAIGYRRRKEEQ